MINASAKIPTGSDLWIAKAGSSCVGRAFLVIGRDHALRIRAMRMPHRADVNDTG